MSTFTTPLTGTAPNQYVSVDAFDAAVRAAIEIEASARMTADMAIIAAGGTIYATVSDGVAETASGGTFCVAASGGAGIDVYRNDSGAAVLLTTLRPDVPAVEAAAALALGSATTAQAAAANAQSSALTCATWAVLSGLTGSTAGQGAEVLDSDGGTHTDPVAGGTVSNAGRYTWSSSPAGWRRIGDTGLSGKLPLKATADASQTAMTALGAGYETINPDAAGYNLVTIYPDRVAITKGKVGYPITVVKSAAQTGNSTWFGIHLKIPYATLADLNKVLTLNAVTLAGIAPSHAVIVKETTDWGAGSDAVMLDATAMMDGGAGVNLYEKIMASDRAAIYQARTYLHVLLAYWQPVAGGTNGLTASWTIRPRFSSALDVVANKLTPALSAELASVNPTVNAAVALVLAPKAALLSQSFVKNNAGSTATIDHTYTKTENGQTVKIGYDFTLLNVSGYTIFAAKIFDSYAANASKKFRVFLKSDRTTTVWVRFTNGTTWGSSDGSLGMAQSTNVTLNAANNYQATVDIDYSAMEAFYGAEGRLQGGWFVIAYDGVVTSEAVQFSTYCCDISDVGSMEGDMTSSGISRLASIAELEDAVEALQNDAQAAAYITCWGDSLTAGGGWTTTLAQLTGLPVYNGGTGGETSKTIMARQGGDVMVVNNITIPATTTPVVIASRATDGGIKTALGATVTPLLQGGAHINPCKIGDVVGTLAWTGSSYADMTGTWTFTRAVAGSAVQITRPTAIRTDFDINRRGGIQIIFMGQNGGYSSNDDLVRQHRLMMEHSTAKHTIILGLSSGSAAARADYEAAMRLAFGRYFISLREYLATPIYTIGVITSCYGLEDAGLTPTQADLDAIATGTVPPQCFTDGIHYTAATKTVLGNMIYARMRDLNVV